MNANERDSRGYTALHRALMVGRWQAVKKALSRGASPDTILPSGATVDDFAIGLNHWRLLERLQKYTKRRLSTHRGNGSPSG